MTGWQLSPEAYPEDAPAPTVSAYSAVSAPTVTLSAATDIATTTATLNGNVTATGGEDPHVTMYWGDNDGGQTPGSWDYSSDPTSPAQHQGVAAFYKSATSLSAGTQYFFSASANNSAGTSWPAASLDFTTLYTPPTFVSATTNTAGTVVEVTFSKAMADPTGKHTQFTVNDGASNTVTAAALHSGDNTTIDLTVTNTILKGKTITVGYTAGTVVATDTGILATFSGQVVTNSSTAVTTVLTPYAWVANYADTTVKKIDITDGSVMGTYNVGVGPYGAAVDVYGNVWVVNQGTNTVTKLNSSGGTIGTYAVGSTPQFVAADASGNVWVTNFYGHIITKLNSSGGTIGTYSVGINPQGVAVDASGNVWVVNAGVDTVTKLNSSGGTIGTYAVGSTPLGVAIDASGNVWVTNELGNNVTKLNSSGGTIGTYAVGTYPHGIAVDVSGNIWVANMTADTVTKLNSSGGLVGTYNVGDAPYAFGDFTGFALQYFVLGYSLPVAAPTVTLSAASLVTTTTARINGNITATGGDNPTVTMYWGTTDIGQTSVGWEHSLTPPTSPDQPQGAAAFYTDVTSLSPNTTYYFTAKAVNSAGTSWPAASLHFNTTAGTVFNQKHFKIYQDDAGLNSATQYAAEDTNYNIPINTNFRIRFETANTGTASSSITRRLEYKENNGSWTQITTGGGGGVIYLDPNGDSTPLQWHPSAAADHYTLIDDGTRQNEGAPNMTDYIDDYDVANKVDVFDMGTDTVETVSEIKVWVYGHVSDYYGVGNPSNEKIVGSIYVDATWQSDVLFDLTDSDAWKSVTFTGTWDQTDLNSLQVRLKSTYCDSGAEEFIYAMYAEVTYTGSSPNVSLVDSTNFTDGDATTSRLTATGTFSAGQGKDTGSDTSSISLANGYYTEDEYSLKFDSGANGNTYQFRITNVGTPLTTYASIPTVSAGVTSLLRIKSPLHIKAPFSVK